MASPEIWSTENSIAIHLGNCVDQITIYNNYTLKGMEETPCDKCSEPRSGIPALAVAAENGHADCLQSLIPLYDAGDVHLFPSQDGETSQGIYNVLNLSLVKSLEHGHSKCVELLRDAGASMNFVAGERKTPLMIAASNGDFDSMKVLIKAGARPNYRGETSLISAAKSNSPMCMEMLIKADADVNLVDVDGCTALFHASDNGYLECLRLLVQAGVDVNSSDARGATPLYAAVCRRLMPCIQFLLDSGADVNIHATRGNTCLIAAAGYRCIRCVNLLLDAGADVNAADYFGNTALIEATESSSVPCMEALIQKGADVNAATREGTTAICGCLLECSTVC